MLFFCMWYDIKDLLNLEHASREWCPYLSILAPGSHVLKEAFSDTTLFNTV